LRIRRLLVIPAGVALASASFIPLAGNASATSPATDDSKVTQKATRDYRPTVLEQRAFALKQEAIQRRIAGDPSAQGDVINVGKAPKAGPAGAAAANDETGVGSKNQYVEYTRTGVSKIFVILAEYGNKVDPRYGHYEDGTAIDGYALPGPMHNNIPKPDRSTDNTSIWRADYNLGHYKDLYFADTEGTTQAPSVSAFFDRQSSGRFTFQGTVNDWVKVPYNGASYGSDYCGDVVCDNVENLVRDALTAFIADQKAAGKTDAQIRGTLAQYDIEDRYDYDQDGNFNEPDGYLDHFQILHSGQDEATGGGTNPASGDFGENAIWSHKGYVAAGDIGETGPSYNQLGGTPIGDTGLWVADYTMQPENAGTGVICHETTHDLGLPDEYDTSGLGDAPTGFWTLMAQASYMNTGQDLGTRPGLLTGWDKLQLGWLDYTTVKKGDGAQTLQLGPSESANTVGPQALVVSLGKKQKTFTYPDPFGSWEWYSYQGNNLNSSMTRTFDLTKWTSAHVTAKVNYDTEEGYDYVYSEASTDGGKTFHKVVAAIDGTPQPDGITGTTDGKWVNYRLNLTPYAGKTFQLRIRYQSDPGVVRPGFFIDNFALTAGPSNTLVYSSGAEAGNDGWALTGGWHRTHGTETIPFDHYYIAESRSYQSYDETLNGGPYNFGFLNTKPNWAERYRYAQGLLVSYWDTSQFDNNTGEHPGEGLILYVDSHPRALIRSSDGLPWSSRIQIYDAPFGLRATPAMTLHRNSVANYIPSLPAVSTFNDARSFYDPVRTDHGVSVPNTGTIIRVLSQDDPSLGSMKVKVTAPTTG
jgi:immune inhibitor A